MSQLQSLKTLFKMWEITASLLLCLFLIVLHITPKILQFPRRCKIKVSINIAVMEKRGREPHLALFKEQLARSLVSSVAQYAILLDIPVVENVTERVM